MTQIVASRMAHDVGASRSPTTASLEQIAALKTAQQHATQTIALRKFVSDPPVHAEGLAAAALGSTRRAEVGHGGAVAEQQEGVRNFIHVSDDAGHRNHGALRPPHALDFQPVSSEVTSPVFSNQFFNQFAQSPVQAPVNASLLTQSGMSLAGASKQRHARGEQPSPARQLPDASAL